MLTHPEHEIKDVKDVFEECDAATALVSSFGICILVAFV